MVSPTDSRETAEENRDVPTSTATPGQLRAAATRDAAPLARQTRSAIETLSMSSVGLEMGLAVIIGLFFGRWLDGKAGTTPWLMILFICFGFAAGMKGVFDAMKKSDRAAARADAEAAADAANASRNAS